MKHAKLRDDNRQKLHTWFPSESKNGLGALCYHVIYQNSHLEDDDPGVGDVVKVDGSFVGVAVPSVTPGVILVPVDAEPRYVDAAVDQRLGAQAQRLPVQDVVLVQAAGPASLAADGDVGAGHDAVVDGEGADEGSLVVLVGHVVGARQADARRAGRGERTDERDTAVNKCMCLNVHVDELFQTIKM